MSEVAEETKTQGKAPKTRTLINKKARKPGECSCEKPTPVKGVMEKVSGGQIHYIYCDVCMEVLDWCDDGGRDLSPEDYAKTGVAASQATPEPSLPPTMAGRFVARDPYPVLSLDDLGGDPVEFVVGPGIAGANVLTRMPEPGPQPEPEKEAKAECEPELPSPMTEAAPEAAPAPQTPTVQQKGFMVTQITPVVGKPDHMNFVCQNNGRFFVVNVPSTEKKVAKALASPTVIVGKKVILEFTETDSSGNPVNAKALRVE